MKSLTTTKLQTSVDYTHEEFNNYKVTNLRNTKKALFEIPPNLK